MLWEQGGVLGEFEARVREAPAAEAVVCGTERVGYRALDARAGQLAARLREAGLTPGSLVAVCAPSGVDAVAGVLAVLKAGAAFLPVDPGMPERSLRHVLAGARPGFVLVGRAHRARVDAGSATLVPLDAPRPPAAGQGAGRAFAAPAAGPDALACALYTAGSAEPAAPVPFDHRTLMTARHAWGEMLALTGGDRHLVTAKAESAAFAAGWTRALCTGGTLVLPAPGEEPRALVAREAVTVLACTVPEAERLSGDAADTRTLRAVCAAGAFWPPDRREVLARELGPGARLLNVYGVTEAVGGGACLEVPPTAAGDAGAGLPVATPFPGIAFVVLGGDGRAVVPGGEGELFLAGPAVARGYAATGDRARILLDGRLVLLGRPGRDAGAEAALRTLPWVRDCVVTRIDDGPADGLRGAPPVMAAYIVLDGAPAGRPHSVRQLLGAVLPAARVPRVVVPVRSLPRTRSGAVDLAALPRPKHPDDSGTPGDGGGKGAAGKGGRAGAARKPRTGLLRAVGAVFSGRRGPAGK